MTKSAKSKLQPQGTTTHDVGPTDTISSIALRFNTTPTELTRLNRLSSQLLYPGQTLFVPAKIKSSTESAHPPAASSEPAPVDNAKHDSHLDVILQKDGLHCSADEVSGHYLKINSKYVTDGQGVVSGVLLVTPETLMFNPSVSDHLVIDRGREMYLIHTPLKSVCHVSFFYDIAAMVLGDYTKNFIPSLLKPDLLSLTQPDHVMRCNAGDLCDISNSPKISTFTPEIELPTSVQSSLNDRISSLNAANSDSSSLWKHDARLRSAGEQKHVDSASVSLSSLLNDVQLDSGSIHLDAGRESIEVRSDAVGLVFTNIGTREAIESEYKEIVNSASIADGVKVSDQVVVPPSGAHAFQLESELERYDGKESVDVESSSEASSRSSSSRLLREDLPEVPATVSGASDAVGPSFFKGHCLPVVPNQLDSDLGIILQGSSKSFIASQQYVPGRKCSLDSSLHGFHVEASGCEPQLSVFMRDHSSSSTPRKRSECLRAIGVREADTSPTSAASESNKFGEASLGGVASALRESGLQLGRSQPLSLAGADGKASSHFHGHLPNAAGSRNQSYPWTSDVSKDSGISEMPRSQFSEIPSDSSLNLSESNSFSTASSLSEEARQWLGKRGIGVASTTKGDHEVPTVSARSRTELRAEEISLPRPASVYKDAFAYVAVRIFKSSWLPLRSRSVSSVGLPPNRDEKRREHWLAIPKERVDQLYSFLLHWCPDLSTSIGRSSSGSDPDVSANEPDDGPVLPGRYSESPASKFGFEKLDHDAFVEEAALHRGSINSLSSRGSPKSIFDEEAPDLVGESKLLTKKQLVDLCRRLPSRTVGHTWELVYSTAIHGISLSTLYRNFKDYETPCLLVVCDETHKVFGAFLSDRPQMSDGFYGTGESMLFSFSRSSSRLETYLWSGDNTFFINGSKQSLAIGGGRGIFGLWLDEDLYRGRSHSCSTFNNATLSEQEDFICSAIEAWAFV